MIRVIFILAFFCQFLSADKILIPMDLAQKDHLKAYGIAFWILSGDINVEWLLNYRGGSFMIENYPAILQECRIRGVTAEIITESDVVNIYGEIDMSNMDIILLEKVPKIAIYSPPNKQPWDDAVTLALTYAEVEYTTLWDEEVFLDYLDKYDWLHLHHEDFTGQYGKFYRSYHNAPWYIQQQNESEAMAIRLGFTSVSEEKKTVAQKIKSYVGRGGFIFAMCSATDALDIALTAEGVDIVESVFDGTPSDPQAQQKLDFNKSFAFENYTLIKDPFIYEFSNIDIPPSDRPTISGPEADYFTLFEFSAKYDPVPSMLTQNHVGIIKGFMGQTTGFRRSLIKKHVTILGEVEGEEQIKYIHGNFGKGTFTFLGGHDPEDYQHFVGDPPTDLSLHRNSPGYRLILNNILFPAARKKERKT
ncbi:MAG: asparagine synthetase B [Candidatus Marinimicrobia bacterium]|nr:asparagine synthetase B [Candidatus Neomarinimicrobiota bacterium]